MPGLYFVSDKCHLDKCQGPTFGSDKCLEAILDRTNAIWTNARDPPSVRTNARTIFRIGQMPGPTFGLDKCQDPLLVWTNARTHFWFGQMPGGQMPAPTFGPDKCQDKCLNPQVQAFVLRGICPPRHRHLSPPGMCSSRHLSRLDK